MTKLTMSMFKNAEDYWKARSCLFGQIVAEVVRELRCERDREAILMALHALKKDAALGRAVRRMPVDAYLLRVAGGWQADAGIVPDIAEGDTLDAVLQAAGLMEVEK